MTYTKLINILLKRKNKKRPIDTAQMKEVIAALSDIYIQKPEEVTRIIKALGKRRAKK